MRIVSLSNWLLAGSLVLGGFVSPVAIGAVDEKAYEQIAAADRPHILDDSAEVELRFFQEDGPDSGHVRVVLTPERRSLTAFEARSAAQQAFLKTLKEPGLGEPLRRITVVVRLMPASHPESSGAEQVIMFQHKGGRDWSVLAGN